MNKSIGTVSQSATRDRAEDSSPWARNPAKIMVGAWFVASGVSCPGPECLVHGTYHKGLDP